MENTETQQPKASKFYRRKLLTSYFTSTLCIALVLYMAGLFFMLLFNTQHISDMFMSNIKMTITLNDKRTQAEIDNFRKNLDASDFVRETKYISKDAATKELIDELGEDFVEILGADKNPLFAQIEIKLEEPYSNLDSINAIQKVLKKNAVVDEVYYPKDIWNNATTVITKIATIVLILTLILLGITIILITNSVRLQMSGNRFDIRTAKLIGASKWKISSPYLKRAFIQSLVAVLISVGGLSLTISFIEKILNGVFMISAFYPTLVTMIALGLGVTMVSAYISISKYLNAKEEDLYY